MVYVATLAGIGVNHFHRTNLALHDVHWCMLAYPDGTNASTKLPWSSQGAHSGRCKCNAAPIRWPQVHGYRNAIRRPLI